MGDLLCRHGVHFQKRVVFDFFGCVEDLGVMTISTCRARCSLRYQQEKQEICILQTHKFFMHAAHPGILTQRDATLSNLLNPIWKPLPSPHPQIRPRSYAHNRSLRPGTDSPSPRAVVSSSISSKSTKCNPTARPFNKQMPFPSRPKERVSSSAQRGIPSTLHCIAVRDPFFSV